jgi:hypothetical protein
MLSLLEPNCEPTRSFCINYIDHTNTNSISHLKIKVVVNFDVNGAADKQRYYEVKTW